MHLSELLNQCPNVTLQSDRRRLRRHCLASSRKRVMYATWNILTASHIQKHTVGDWDSRGRGKGADGNFRTPTCIACLVGVRKGRGRKFRLRAHNNTIFLGTCYLLEAGEGWCNSFFPREFFLCPPPISCRKNVTLPLVWPKIVMTLPTLKDMTGIIERDQLLPCDEGRRQYDI